jgi:hypothetical protein
MKPRIWILAALLILSFTACKGGTEKAPDPAPAEKATDGEKGRAEKAAAPQPAEQQKPPEVPKVAAPEPDPSDAPAPNKPEELMEMKVMAEEAPARASRALEKADEAEEAMDGLAKESAAMDDEAGAPGLGAGSKDESKKKGKNGDDDKDEPVKTWKKARVVPNMSRLMVGDDEELPLKGMQVHVQVDGLRARVVLDLHYFNDRSDQLEGNFSLRLPDGAAPYFLAFGGEVTPADKAPGVPTFQSADAARGMDPSPERLLKDREGTWTNVKDARMVPKEKAAFAYHDTVRRRVDPALMEWSGAGVFSARVFPLAPMQLHKIVVAYDVDLLRAGKELVYALDLPPTSVETIVDLHVNAGDGLTHTLAPAAEAVAGEGVAHYRFERPDAPTITVRVQAPDAVLMAGTDPGTGDYVAARFTPPLDQVKNAEAPKGTPTAVFLVDTSLSANPEKFNVWLGLMEAILEANRDQLTEFAVLFFNVETAWWQEGFTPNTPENVKALMDFAKGLALEGATDLDAALAAAAKPAWNPGEKSWDTFLLSDGSVTWGEGDNHALAARLRSGNRGPVFAYRTGLAGTDTAVLTHLTRESGGAVFAVVGESQIAAAATAHRARPWRILGVELAGTTDLILAGRPGALFPGQEVTLAGRGVPAEGAQINLRLEQVGYETLFEIPIHATLASDLAPRVYGQVAVGQLESFDAAAEDVAGAYARHFRVVGKTTSLLMLESEEDYLRYDIKPEEDAFLVKGTPAGARVAKILAEIGDALGDPKAAFQAWLEKLGKMPGMEFEVPAALKVVLEQLPADVFRVSAPPLVCAQRMTREIPGDLQEQLITRKLVYDKWTEEAERRLKAHGPADALKALSNLVENAPGDSVLARDVGYSAMEMGLGAQAYHLFRRVAASRPFEPQTYRAMAQALTALGANDLALLYYEVGMIGRWDSRFGEFRKILLMDYQKFLEQVVAGTLQLRSADYAKARLETVSKEIALSKADLVVMIDWNTDGTDVDLHVMEPTGEECYYSNANTRIGGQLTMDVTQGYGPEMYVLEKAPAGTYQIRAKYFSSDANRASTRTKVFATVYRDWGRPTESVQKKTVVLRDGKEMHDLATVVVKAAKK